MKRLPFTVNSRKYDLSLRRSWTGHLLRRNSERILLEGFFDADVSHPDLGLIRNGTRSVESFFADRWYNHFAFYEPAGDFRNHYINISMPPEIGDASVDYVDLDIDIIIWPDGRVDLLDQEEFEKNAVLYHYPAEIRARTIRTKDEILEKPSRFINIMYSTF